MTLQQAIDELDASGLNPGLEIRFYLPDPVPVYYVHLPGRLCGSSTLEQAMIEFRQVVGDPPGPAADDLEAKIKNLKTKGK